MIYGVYAIKDEKVGYLQLMQDSNDFTASRNFKYAISRPESLYFANRTDFKLYKFGTFDSERGEFDVYPTPQLMADGANVE